MYFNVKDASYWYEIHGKGTPVILLHGFTGSGKSWQEVIDLIKGPTQLITVDLPGHGKTKTSVIKTMEACISDLHELFKELELSSFFLLGYSMGGRTALTYAKTYPEKIKGLILESASPGLATEEERKERREVDEKLINRIKTDGLEDFVDFWENIPLFASQNDLEPARKEKIRKGRLEATPAGLMQSLKGMGTGRQVSNWNQLKDLRFPVLLLVGSLDGKFVDINRKMSRQIPYADFEIIEDTGHSIHVEKPVTYGKIVIRFIQQHETKLK